ELQLAEPYRRPRRIMRDHCAEDPVSMPVERAIGRLPELKCSGELTPPEKHPGVEEHERPLAEGTVSPRLVTRRFPTCQRQRPVDLIQSQQRGNLDDGREGIDRTTVASAVSETSPPCPGERLRIALL